MDLHEKMYYTRTIDGTIGLCRMEGMTPEQYVETYKDVFGIKNASYNLNDLVEEGDIISGKIRGWKYINKRLVYYDRIVGKLFVGDDEFNQTFIEDIDIEEILTKELYEKEVYKVG